MKKSELELYPDLPYSLNYPRKYTLAGRARKESETKNKPNEKLNRNYERLRNSRKRP